MTSSPNGRDACDLPFIADDMELTGKQWHRMTNFFAVLALLWTAMGPCQYDRYVELFRPPLVPDGGGFNPFHDGVILLFGVIGVIAGILTIRKSGVWATGLFLNVIILCIVLLVNVL